MTSVLVVAGTATLIAWALAVALVGSIARARRPEPPRTPPAGPRRAPADPALRRLLEAVRRHPRGRRLRRALLAAAFEGLLEREAVTVDVRREGPWATVHDRVPEELLPHERLLLDHLQRASRRAAGPLPLAALRPTRGVADGRGWVTGLADEAVAWGRRTGYLRELVPSGVRTWLVTGLLVPVELLIAAALVAAGPDGGTVGGALVAGLLGGSVLGTLLTAPLDGHGLTALAGRALTEPAPDPGPGRPARQLARLLTTGGSRRRAWSSADESWRPVRVSTRGLATRDHEPRAVRTANLALVCVLAVVAVFLLYVTPTALRLSDVSAFFVLAWWGTWLLLAPRAVLRLAAAWSDLRTGPVVWTGQVVQRRPVETADKEPATTSEGLPIVALDIGGGTVRTVAVDEGTFSSLGPGAWARVVVTPRLRHLVSIEPLPAPGGVGLPAPRGRG